MNGNTDERKIDDLHSKIQRLYASLMGENRPKRQHKIQQKIEKIRRKIGQLERT